jgi:hypothetical protein
MEVLKHLQFEFLDVKGLVSKHNEPISEEDSEANSRTGLTETTMVDFVDGLIN